MYNLKSWIYQLSTLIIIISLFTYSESNAQDDDGGSLGIGPQIGYQKAADADEGSIMFGGFIRAKLSQAFGLEGSINYRSEEYLDGNISVRSWPVLVSALIYPIPTVYGLAGVGWYNTTFDFDPGLTEDDLGDETESEFGFHLGAGVEFPLSESVKLTGDIKYVFLDYNWEDIENTPLSEFKNNFYIINVGLAFGLR